MIRIEKASAVRPYLKVALFGQTGTLKTRTALAFPAPLVVDTENGTDHYGGEFDFSRVATTEPKAVAELIAQIGAAPGEFRTLVVDSWSVYCEAVTSAFCDIFLRKETKSAGHKGEYYQLSPRDYQPINRELMRQVRALLRLRCHVILAMQEKDEYTGMEKSGVTFDGFKRSPYYMDTVIHLLKRRDVKTGETVIVGEVEKDRTGKLPARIAPFSIDALRKCWGEFFDRDSEAGGNVFEEPAIPTVIVPVDPAPVAPLARTPGTQAAAPAESTPPPVASPAAAATEATEGALAIDEPPSASKADKLKALIELRAALAIPDAAWAGILEKRKVKDSSKLTDKAIIEIMGKLETKLSAEQLAGWVKRWPFRAGAAAAAG